MDDYKSTKAQQTKINIKHNAIQQHIIDKIIQMYLMTPFIFPWEIYGV